MILFILVEKSKYKISAETKMRYNELDEMIGVKKYSNMTAHDLLRHLGGNSGSQVQILGDGSHAVALKIKDRVYKFWLLDSAYESYVKYSLNHKDNPFVPKFRGGIKTLPAFFLRSEQSPDTVKYVEMEELYKVSPAEYEAMTFDLLGSSNKTGARDVYPIKLGQILVWAEECLWGFSDFLTKASLSLDVTFAMNEQDWEFSQLVDLLIDLRDLDGFVDLHSDNVMKRSNGQLVIIDPIADSDDHTVNMKMAQFAKTPNNQTGKPASRRTPK